MNCTRLILVLICVAIAGALRAQLTKEQAIQRKRTDAVMRYLEEQKVDSIVPFIAVQCLKNDTTTISNLNWASKEVQSFKSRTKLSVVIVYDNDKNIFRCRYYNRDSTFIQVDVFYLAKDESATIAKFEFKDKVQLAKEQKEREAIQSPPPAPPPPPPPPRRR